MTNLHKEYLLLVDFSQFTQSGSTEKVHVKGRRKYCSKRFQKSDTYIRRSNTERTKKYFSQLVRSTVRKDVCDA